MTELAGFGTPGFLPLSVRLAQQAEARTEAQAARQHQAEVAERVETRRSADVALVIAAAEARGERVDPVTVATGRVQGRSIADVLAAAAAAEDGDDSRARLAARRERGEHLDFVGELADPDQVPPPVTATRMAVQRRTDAFDAALTARREADEARRALENRMPRLAAPHWSAGRNRHTSSRAQGSRASLGTDYFGRPITADRLSYR